MLKLDAATASTMIVPIGMSRDIGIDAHLRQAVVEHAEDQPPNRVASRRGSTSTDTLQGKIAVVAGGATGIGLATAKRFAAEGAQVFVTGRRQAELDAAGASIGTRATGIQADSTRT